MKKVSALIFSVTLAGCAADSENTMILTSTQEEIPMVEQVNTQLKQDAVVVVSAPAAVTPAPAPKKVYQPKPVETKAADLPLQSSETVAEGYTIQVLALSHNKGFADYGTILNNDQPLWVNEKQLSGLPWYTLLYGQYSTKLAAKQAIKQLPQSIQDNGPFVKSLSDIQQSPTPKLLKIN